MAYPGYEGYGAADPYGYGSSYGAASYAAPMGVPHGYGGDELRTVFITGFPGDVKERELNNLLRFLPGYEASQMTFGKGQVQGFALFATGSTARAACSAVAGLLFDDGVHLRAEMAHKNMYLKDDGAGVKRARTAGGYVTPSSGGGGGYGAPARSAGGSYSQGAAQNAKDNPPCNTLFVGNLSDAVVESELQSLFGAQPGFQQLKVLRNARAVSCFVEFDTVETAMACHQSQQGAVLSSSDRGPLRIQYSKNPFGKKRDSSGQMIETRPSGTADGTGQLAGTYSEGLPSSGVVYNAGSSGGAGIL
eukprot:gene11795-11940_t